MTALAIFTAIAMLFAPLIARLFALDTHGRRARRAAARDDGLHPLLPAADGVLRLHRARDRAAERAPPVRRRRVRAGRQQRRRDRRARSCSRRSTSSRARRGHRRRAHPRRPRAARCCSASARPRASSRWRSCSCPRCARAGIQLRSVFDVARPRGPQDAAAVGLDRRLRRHEPDRAAVRARAREERPTGNVSAYLYAYTFYVVPHGLLAVSIMTTMMPELARRAPAGDIAGPAPRVPRSGCATSSCSCCPRRCCSSCSRNRCSACIVRGQFTAHDAVVTADTLQAFAIGLVPFSVYLYALRAFYALQDTRTPFLINAIENGVNIVLALVLFPSLGVQGLALAWSGAYIVAAVVALVVAAPPDRRRARRRRDRARPPRPRVAAASCSRSSPRRSRPRSGTRRPPRRSLATAVAGARRAAGLRSSCSSSCCAPTSWRSLVAVGAARGAASPDV